MVRIWEVLGSTRGRRPVILAENFRGFPRCLKANSGIDILQILHWNKQDTFLTLCSDFILQSLLSTVHTLPPTLRTFYEPLNREQSIFLKEPHLSATLTSSADSAQHEFVTFTAMSQQLSANVHQLPSHFLREYHENSSCSLLSLSEISNYACTQSRETTFLFLLPAKKRRFRLIIFQRNFGDRCRV
jgi:hypothetical protein